MSADDPGGHALVLRAALLPRDDGCLHAEYLGGRDFAASGMWPGVAMKFPGTGFRLPGFLVDQCSQFWRSK